MIKGFVYDLAHFEIIIINASLQWIKLDVFRELCSTLEKNHRLKTLPFSKIAIKPLKPAWPRVGRIMIKNLRDLHKVDRQHKLAKIL